jgi:hypothetical protein
LPRRVNVLCDRALQEGRITGMSTITGDLVKRAARALAGAHPPPPSAAPASSASSVAPGAPAAAAGSGAAPAAKSPATPTTPVTLAAPTTPTRLSSLERESLALSTAREIADPEPSLDELLYQESPSHRLRNLMLAGAVIALAAAGAYYAYASNVVSAHEASTIRAPRPPIREVGDPITSIDVPTDEQIHEIFSPSVTPPAAPMSTPTAIVPPATQPAAPLSSQPGAAR